MIVADMRHTPRMTSPRCDPAGRARRAAIVFVSVVVMIGCGGDGDADESSRAETQDMAGARTETSACQLLTAEEFAAAVGNPISRAFSFGGQWTCSYETEEITDVSGVLGLLPTGPGLDWEATCDRAVGAGLDVPKLEREPLQGIGRRAWIMHSTATRDVEPGKRLTNTELQVCADNGVVTLGLGGTHTPAVLQETAVALVNQVLARW
jgi:hypothetical protein